MDTVIDTGRLLLRRFTTDDLEAFYQLGSDGYNDNIFKSMARGDATGIQESWEPTMGGETYSRRNQPLAGDQPWVA